MFNKSKQSTTKEINFCLLTILSCEHAERLRQGKRQGKRQS